MELFKKTGNLLAEIENPNIPLVKYILGFVSILLVYNFLEIFSDPGFVPFGLLPFTSDLAIPASVSIAIHFLHVSLWWVAIALILSLIFSLVTKESIEKTLRVTLSFSWLILLTPLTDLYASWGQGLDISYVYPKKLADLLYLPLAITPGENLTLIFVICLGFNYCLNKTKKIAKATIAAILIILSVIFAALIPFIMRDVANQFRINLEDITPIPVIRLLSFIIFIALVLIFYLQNKKQLLSVLKAMGLFKTLNFILFFMLGMLIFKAHIGKLLLENIGSFLLSIAAISLTWAFANIVSLLNNQDQAANRNSALAVFLLAALVSLAVNFTTFFFIALGCGASLLYLTEPFRLKRFSLLSKTVISFCLLLLVILGWLFAGGEISIFPHSMSLYLLVFFTIGLNFVDLKDYTADRDAGIKTTPVALGEKRARFVIGFTFLVAYLVMPFLFLDNFLLVPALLFGLLQFYTINHKNYQEKFVFTTYLISLICLMVWLNFFKV